MSSLAPNATPRQRSQLSSFNASFYGPQNQQAADNRRGGTYTAGQAQPVQPQSQGTQYGQQPAPRAQDFSVYRPQQAQGNPFAQYNPQQTGNFVQQQMGLPSFQFTATDSFGNTYDNPAALTAQQGAMAQALNAQRAQQIQSGNIGRLNPMAAYQQAQNMVQGGWTNPFAQPNSQQIGTMGGPPSDPRWSHNGGQWQSGQAQPIQPPQARPGGPGNPFLGGTYYQPALPGGSMPSFGGGFSMPPQGQGPGSSFFPGGQAQPIQPPSQGTPYGGQQNIGIGPGLRAFGGYETEEEAKRAAYRSRIDPMWQEAIKSQKREWNPNLIQATQEQIDSGEYHDLVRLGNAPGPDGRPSGGGSVWYHPTNGGKYYIPKYGTPQYEAWNKFENESAAREQERFRAAWRDIEARNPYNAGDYAVKTGLSPGKYTATYTPGQTQPTPPGQPPRQANPNTPTFGVYPPGTVSSPDSPVPAPIRPAAPGQAQPVPPPSQGTPYGQPVLRAHEDPMNPTGPNYTPPPRPGQPPSQMPPAQQGPTLASFLESESGLTIDDVMAKGGMMWSTLNHYLGGKLNAKQKTQLQQIQNAWRAKEQMKGGLGGATGIWEMPPEAKYGPPEKRKKAQAEWEQKKAWQKQRDDAEIKKQLSDLLNSVSGGGHALPH